MKIYNGCLPCFVRQSLEAVELAQPDESMKKKILRRFFIELSRIDYNQSPPQIGQKIHRIVREITGIEDIYKTIKDKCNKTGMKYLLQLKKMVNNSSNKFDTAVRLAIAGNIIDFGTNSYKAESDIELAINRTLEYDFGSGISQLEDAITQAKRILYLGDNCGETFFDRVLIEQMPWDKITYAVRGKPILNDALIDDARTAEIDKMVRIIDNGSDAPGTVFEQCNEKFKMEFNKADLIISKGQGNYETLNTVDKDIFFMLKVKCLVISEYLGCRIGTPVLLRQKQKVLTV